MSYVKLLSIFSNKMHFVQPRHLHYTDVTLYHIRVSLVLGLGLDCVARCLDLEELSLESMPGVDPSHSLGSEPECPRISGIRLYPSLIV